MFLRAETSAPENHDPPKTGIPNRKKIGIKPRLSGKIDYSITPKSESHSMSWPFFTGDSITYFGFLPIDWISKIVGQRLGQQKQKLAMPDGKSGARQTKGATIAGNES